MTKKTAVARPTKDVLMTRNERLAQVLLKHTEEIEKAGKQTQAEFLGSLVGVNLVFLLGGAFFAWLFSATLAPWLSIVIGLLGIVCAGLASYATFDDRRTGKRWAMKKKVTALEQELGMTRPGAALICIYCDHPIGKEDAFCINCGRRQEPIIGRKCEKGHVTPLHGAFCRVCGIPLTGKPEFVYVGDVDRETAEKLRNRNDGATL